MEVDGDAERHDSPLSPKKLDSIPIRKSASEPTMDEDSDYCRICRGEGTTAQPLFYPCKCSGSIKYVHQDCLMEWLSHSQKKYCELCKTAFRFTKLYDQSMPSTIPLPLFLQQAAFQAMRTISKWTRFLIVGLVWFFWLPWSIRQVWRGLFWLADGSWVSEQSLAKDLLAEATGTASSAASPSVQSVVEFDSLNSTVKLALEEALAPTSGLSSSSIGEFFVKIIRPLSLNFFRWSLTFISANPADDSTMLHSSDRQPSLLSDVNFFNSLTKYSFVNNALIDTVEGQLVCLIIITAFILVFLIREWVINQQPILNMPDMDRADNLDVPAPEIGDGGHGARRHGRAHRRGAEQNERGQGVADRNAQNAQRPRGPRTRRATTDENVGRPAPAPLDISRPDAQVMLDRTFSSPANLASTGIEGGRRPSTPSEPALHEFWQQTRPILVRGAIDEGAALHRTIEEGSGLYANQSQPASEPFDEWVPRVGVDYAEGLGMSGGDSEASESIWITERRNSLPSDANLLTDASSKSGRRRVWDSGGGEDTSLSHADHPQRGDIVAGGDEGLGSNTFLGGADNIQNLDILGYPKNANTLNQTIGDDISESESIKGASILADYAGSTSTKHTATSGRRDMFENLSDNRTDASEDDHLSMAHSSDLDHFSDFPDLELAEAESDDATEGNDEGDTAVEGRSFFEPIFAWLWQADDFTPTQPVATDADDEHDVQELEDEPPFIQIRAQEAVDPAEMGVENDPPLPAMLDPNFEDGIGQNNVDAIDDAEDLDGILELIGMQGPIAGMVQNVIFSEFLIALTIAVTVWLPYIWGKNALLVLANPVGVFIKGPLYIVSKAADTLVDLLLCTIGLLGYTLNYASKAAKALLSPTVPRLGDLMDTSGVDNLTLSLAMNSGRRLEKVLSGTVFILKPDFPTFSMQSHRALLVFEKRATDLFFAAGEVVSALVFDLPSKLQMGLHEISSADDKFYRLLRMVSCVPRVILAVPSYLSTHFSEVSAYVKPLSAAEADAINKNLMRWSTRDKILAIILGYMFFSFVGYLYLKISHIMQGLKSEEKVEGIVADSLRQAGGVLKVIVIVGIEMIVFPLYCGFLLDVALMPLFGGHSLQSRVKFMFRAPITGLFVHWFIGTCYMFHFALFVSMCRKIMRKGVLYFIRDPDDPTFHPVRDVLERPVATQLGKIAFSALVYGGLVILCLGGVVWGLNSIDGVLPIHWATNEPRLALPVDILFYNFLLPFVIRKVDPSAKILITYEWWFRGCARALRLTHFLFGEEREEEKGTHVRRTWAALLRLKRSDVNKPVIGEDRRILAEDRELDTYFYRDGTYVRAPATDSVRIPKGDRVFLEVNENNERIDGEEDHDKGMHGRTDERFTKVYIPPNFRVRIAAFVLLLWVFAALTGVASTVGPLLVGRKTIQYMSQREHPPNDLYALTVGVHVCGGLVYAVCRWRRYKLWLSDWARYYFQNTRQALRQLYSTAKYVLGLVYMILAFGVFLPFALSLLTELYFNVPLYAFMTSTSANPVDEASELRPNEPKIYIFQTWTLGLLYLRLAWRFSINYPHARSRAATAIRAITRGGVWHPNVRLATRAFIIPALVLCAALFALPLGLGRLVITIFKIETAEEVEKVYYFCYPGFLTFCIAVFSAIMLKRQVEVWRVRIKDEVYLIGERLHNFQEVKRAARSDMVRKRDKGKERFVAAEAEGRERQDETPVGDGTVRKNQ